jgi:aerobic carbon-monoxide dehydrogenase medium subunit
MAQSPEVILPTSEREAVDAFGDGRGIPVVAGGTIVVPDMTYGRRRPERALVLGRAGLDGVRREGGRVVIGATTTVSALTDGPEPLASAARGVADPEVRNAGTIGGNLCAGPGHDAPRGDLQGALVALGAQVRSAGAGGERTEPVEDFLAGSPADRLVLSVEFDEPARWGYARYERPHAHTYTILAVSVTAGASALDELRIAVTGAGPVARRCPSAEAALRAGGDAAVVLDDVDVQDDALASAWYRSRILPTLVARAVASLA